MLEEYDIEIKGIIESSFVDWDGKVVTTLYLPKCNFCCPFCYNWELIEHPENFNTVMPSHIDHYLRTNHDFIDGVCLTGGEPTVYRGLSQLISHIRELGFAVKLDTNGTEPEIISDLIENNKLDYIAMDIKGPLDDRYDRLTGIKTDVRKLKKSIKIIMESQLDYEFRTTVVPTLLNEDDIKDMSESIAGAKKYVLQQFIPDRVRNKGLREVKPFSKENLEKMLNLAKRNIDNVHLRSVK